MTKNHFFHNGTLVEEKIEKKGLLLFLYRGFWGKFLKLFFKSKLAAKLSGFWHGSKFSRYQIKSFISKHKIKMDDFIIPDRGFQSFNNFFIRKLKPGARRIDGGNLSIVAPSDSKLFIYHGISDDSDFFVKDKKFNMEDFLQDRRLSEKLAGGDLFLFRLAPYDYHWFHFPFSCIPSGPQKISGALETVNPIVYSQQERLTPTCVNERHVLKLESEMGLAFMVVVGAMFVGKISYEYSPGSFHEKGEGMGYFSFGGSLVTLVFEKNCLKIDKELLTRSFDGIETVVKMGEKIACFNKVLV